MRKSDDSPLALTLTSPPGHYASGPYAPSYMVNVQVCIGRVHAEGF